MSDFDELGRQSDLFRQAIAVEDGRAWKESYVENHLQFKEIPVWILVFEDSNLIDVNQEFIAVLSSFKDAFGDCNITVCYQTFEEDELFQLDYLDNTAEILRGYAIGPLGENEEKIDPEFIVFKSCDAKCSHT